MAKHIESYLCIVCNAIVVPTYRWAGSQIAVSCGQCGREFRKIRPNPTVLSAVGPRPVRTDTGDLFGANQEGQS